MKALARRMLLILVLMAALGGCGRQDRYEIVAPPSQNVSQGEDWARLTPLHVPNVSTGGLGAVVAWAADDYLMGLRWGEVYRVRGDQYLRQDWPGTDLVVGLVIRADGSVWGLDWGGRLCTLQGTTWNLEVDLLEGSGLTGLLEDDQGRLTAFGNAGLLLRETETGWESLQTDPNQHFIDAWAGPGQGTFLINEKLEVYQVGEEELELLVRLGQNEVSGYSRIEGDGTGRLAVCEPNRREVWVLDGGQWLLVEEELAIKDVFWMDAELMGVPSYPQQVVRWEDGQRQVVADFPVNFSTSEIRSGALDGGRLIACGSAGILNLQDEQISVVSPPLGQVAGLTDFQGQTHALLDLGTHLVSTDTGWQLMGWPLAGTSSLRPAALKIDRAGRLMFVGSEFIATWDGIGYQTYDGDGWDWAKAFYQPDGSVFLFEFWGTWTLFSGETFTEIPHYQNDWDDVVGVVLGEDDLGWIADGFRLGRLDRGQIEVELMMQSRWIKGLVHDPIRGTIVYGTGRVLIMTDSGYEDITPMIVGDDDPQGVAIFNLYPDDQGGLVAWDSEHDLLLLHDGTQWIHQGDIGLTSWWNTVQLSPNPDGSFYLWDRDLQFFHLDRLAAP